MAAWKGAVCRREDEEAHIWISDPPGGAKAVPVRAVLGAARGAAPGSAPGSQNAVSATSTTTTTTTTKAPTTTTTTEAPTTTTTEAPADANAAPADTVTEVSHDLPGSSGTRTRNLICEGSRATFVCPIDTYIYVEYAQWGRDNEFTCNETTKNVTNMCNSGSGALDTVISKCDGVNSCNLYASINEFGDPCESRTAMYLVVEYSCRRKYYDALVCQDSGRLPLTCPENQVISTQGAFFGRGNLNTTCPSVDGVPTNNCSADFPSTIFSFLCDGKRDCELEASTDLFGDPCPNSRKYLSATYTCEECTNDEDDIYCEIQAMEGECEANPDWMKVNCRKACTKCQSEPPTSENRWFNDTQCNEWTKAGECDKNPVWMFAYCKGSCLGLNSKTDCKNKPVHDANCGLWGTQGECLTNTNWMFPNCTRDCFHCEADQTDVVECKNRFDTDQCDKWAAFGECGFNQGFMIPNCMKSCLGCKKDPVCVNVHDDDVCDYWASIGECWKNVVWMHQKCWKSCMQCDGPKECTNKNDDQTCEHWAAVGLISTRPEYMTTECWKTTSGCAGNTKVYDCLNTGDADADCDYWSMIGECGARPTYLYTNCYKSCSKCGDADNELVYIGNSPEPGLPEDMTAYNVILLPETFPVDAKLTNFFGYFHNISTVYFQIWRYENGSFVLKYNQQASPDVTMTSQTINVDSCMMVQAGDYFGFADFSGIPTIGATDDAQGIVAPHFYKGSTNAVPFSTLSINKKFSVGAAYSTTDTC
ncbi:hypothetical protein CAPTEDRAFT_227133 [Capitella teleta]|uniref:SUEL-type lectin domain-containing protein n=1 Tax=Capitella teleta TaxID=283909 RepID=R7UBJ0_CAPTE|nr:hypothetical protein CAPTEDRAFT_227133 [Capitella teleta]|eukprot:ELU03446.1 hypothetical protein CAPTEDRAFT_227133 [Capitella teleta]